MEGVFKKVLPLSSKAHLSSSRLPSAYALWLSIPHSKWKRLRYVFQKSTKKTEYKHLHPYKNAKIYIFAQKYHLELMHEGIMVFINSNTPFLKSLGTFSQTPSYSWLRGWEYKITAWTLEIGTNVPSFKFTRQTRQVPSFRLSLQLGTHMYWLHSPNPQVPSCTILFLARNTASMLCSEHCFFACFYARNTASLPASVFGTLLLCRLICSEHCFFVCFYAPNTASMLGTLFSCLIPLLYACFYALLGTLLLCRFQASDYPLFGTHIYWLHTPNPHLSRNQACSELMIISNVAKKSITFQSRKCTIIKKVQWRHQCNISFLEFLQLNKYETAQDFFSIMP